jgi:hypothetical protein
MNRPKYRPIELLFKSGKEFKYNGISRKHVPKFQIECICTVLF